MRYLIPFLLLYVFGCAAPIRYSFNEATRELSDKTLMKTIEEALECNIKHSSLNYDINTERFRVVNEGTNLITLTVHHKARAVYYRKVVRHWFTSKRGRYYVRLYDSGGMVYFLVVSDVNLATKFLDAVYELGRRDTKKRRG